MVEGGCRPAIDEMIDRICRASISIFDVRSEAKRARKSSEQTDYALPLPCFLTILKLRIDSLKQNSYVIERSPPCK